LADKVSRHQGPGFDLEILRRSPWYQPASEHPEWTAFGAVLELALRSAIARWRGEPGKWAADTSWVRPGEVGRPPQLLFSRGQDAPTPLSLTVRLTAFDRIRSLAARQTCLRSNIVWQLEPADLPWRRRPRSADDLTATPSAEEIWHWASGVSQNSPGKFLGVDRG
jgi:hypothetical protein